MDEAALGLHEMYSAFRRAGFTRTEATTIIAKTTAEMLAVAMGEAEDDNGDG